MSDDDTQRSLGRLEAVQDAHDARLTRIEGKLDHLVELADRTRGGWQMLMAVGGIGGALGAAAMKLLTWLHR